MDKWNVRYLYSSKSTLNKAQYSPNILAQIKDVNFPELMSL